MIVTAVIVYVSRASAAVLLEALRLLEKRRAADRLRRAEQAVRGFRQRAIGDAVVGSEHVAVGLEVLEERLRQRAELRRQRARLAESDQLVDVAADLLVLIEHDDFAAVAGPQPEIPRAQWLVTRERRHDHLGIRKTRDLRGRHAGGEGRSAHGLPLVLSVRLVEDRRRPVGRRRVIRNRDRDGRSELRAVRRECEHLSCARHACRQRRRALRALRDGDRCVRRQGACRNDDLRAVRPRRGSAGRSDARGRRRTAARRRAGVPASVASAAATSGQ